MIMMLVTIICVLCGIILMFYDNVEDCLVTRGLTTQPVTPHKVSPATDCGPALDTKTHAQCHAIHDPPSCP